MKKLICIGLLALIAVMLLACSATPKSPKFAEYNTPKCALVHQRVDKLEHTWVELVYQCNDGRRVEFDIKSSGCNGGWEALAKNTNGAKFDNAPVSDRTTPEDEGHDIVNSINHFCMSDSELAALMKPSHPLPPPSQAEQRRGELAKRCSVNWLGKNEKVCRQEFGADLTKIQDAVQNGTVSP